MPQIIDCSFSLLDTGRQYTGNHRKYVIENARDICYSKVTRERIKNRDALGYYGHGRRILFGDMDVGETSLINLPGRPPAIITNIPSNVTLAFEVDKDGSVRHSQEILDTEPGKIVTSLNASRIGGFSWACPGDDGRMSRSTILTGFSGFDYVLAPGFTTNRGYSLEGYVTESSDDSLGRIYESVSAVYGGDMKKTEQIVAGWQWGSNTDYGESAFATENSYAELNENARSMLEAERKKFKSVLEGIAGSLPIFIPADVMNEMLEGDFERAKGIFESAKYFDFSQLPVPGSLKKFENVQALPRKAEEVDYGTAAYGLNLKL